MASRQATLIQDISDFRVIVEPHLRPLVNARQLDFEGALRWLICEELELQAGLFDKQHQHNHPEFLPIYHELIHTFPYDFPVFLSRYIRMPQVYDDHNQVDVVLTRRDLFIIYYTQCVSWPPDYEALLRQTQSHGHLPR